MKGFKLKTGTVALITGAGGLLGLEHAIAVLEIGAGVVITDIDDAKLKSAREKLSSRFPNALVRTEILDVTKKEAIQELADRLQQESIEISILINNAAIDPKMVKGEGNNSMASRFEHFSLEDWNMQLDVGLTGAFLCSQIFGSKMAENGAGNIVNIASDLSVIAPDQRIYESDRYSANQQPVKPISYSVIKTGLVGFTRYLATYWASNGVRCNCLSPGGVFNDQPDEFLEKVTNRIPQGRLAYRSEYRGSIQFLCSDASSYMTGHNLVVDGGRSVW